SQPTHWSYVYSKPFVAFVFAPETSSAEAIKDRFAKQFALLSSLNHYFNQNYRDPWELKRKYPNTSDQEWNEEVALELVVWPNQGNYLEYKSQTLGTPAELPHFF